jgi:hypothetical protein
LTLSSNPNRDLIGNTSFGGNTYKRIIILYAHSVHLLSSHTRNPHVNTENIRYGNEQRTRDLFDPEQHRVCWVHRLPQQLRGDSRTSASVFQSACADKHNRIPARRKEWNHDEIIYYTLYYVHKRIHWYITCEQSRQKWAGHAFVVGVLVAASRASYTTLCTIIYTHSRTYTLRTVGPYRTCTHTHTHKHARTHARVCVCVWFGGYYMF